MCVVQSSGRGTIPAMVGPLLHWTLRAIRHPDIRRFHLRRKLRRLYRKRTRARTIGEKTILTLAIQEVRRLAREYGCEDLLYRAGKEGARRVGQ